MANEEHLRIWKQGVRTWNEWRSNNPTVVPDLNSANLSGGRYLWHANLIGADLRGADLSSTDLSRSDLSEADLSSANLLRAHFTETKFTRSRLTSANLESAYFGDADLSGANLENANLTSAELPRARLSGACLTRAKLLDAKLIGADLSNTRLDYVDFGIADLNDANLSNAYIYGADLYNADLSGVDLSGAHLHLANFNSAILHEANLSKAGIGATVFANNDLSLVKGLDSVRHSQPSSISVDTLLKSAGKIPDSFLRSCGIPDNFITFIPSLIEIQTIQFHSCFISYNTKDEEFARRLHSRLRDERIRVWFAPEDVKGGEKLYDQIQRAIQLYDRLLLILSEHSMQSEWVATEIRRARKEEMKLKQRKLFPITLVSFEKIGNWECFDADSGKDLAVEVREYFIPDFSNWNDDDSFEASFKKLLKDLRAAES